MERKKVFTWGKNSIPTWYFWYTNMIAFFFILVHQHGNRDITWKWSTDGLTKEIILSFRTLSYGDNSKAAVIRIGLKEMIQFAQRFYENVELETFFESCGVADLITTCYGGRNRIAGEEFVKGKVRGIKFQPQLIRGRQGWPRKPDWYII